MFFNNLGLDAVSPAVTLILCTFQGGATMKASNTHHGELKMNPYDQPLDKGQSPNKQPVPKPKGISYDTRNVELLYCLSS